MDSLLDTIVTTGEQVNRAWWSIGSTPASFKAQNPAFQSLRPQGKGFALAASSTPRTRMQRRGEVLCADQMQATRLKGSGRQYPPCIRAYRSGPRSAIRGHLEALLRIRR
jgi:hypothetical protein